MFEKNSHLDFKASEVKYTADKIVKAQQDENKRKLRAEFDRYHDWITNWGISIDGAKTLETIMINIRDKALSGAYLYTYEFRVGKNTDDDVAIIKNILEDMGFKVNYEIRSATPAMWNSTIATITWSE